MQADDQLMTQIMCETATEKIMHIDRLTDVQLAELLMCDALDHPHHTFSEVQTYVQAEIVERFMRRMVAEDAR